MKGDARTDEGRKTSKRHIIECSERERERGETDGERERRRRERKREGEDAREGERGRQQVLKKITKSLES